MTALALREIVRNVLENLSDVPDLLACACVNKAWNEEALRILYRGSLIDMQFRSPDIESLNCLLVASRERFAFNMGFVKHLLLRPDAPSDDAAARPTRRVACFQKFRALRHFQDVERMFSPHRTCLSSLTIPFEIMGEDFGQVADLLPQTTVNYLAIDISYCEPLAYRLSPPRGQGSPLKAFENLRALAIYYPRDDDGIDELCELLASCRLKFFQLENQFSPYQATAAIPENLLSSLEEQTGLEVLALNGMHCDIFENPGNSNPTNLDDEPAWPLLKALYLRTCNQKCLKQLLKFEYVQVIAIGQADPNARRFTPEAAGYIGMCPTLRAVDLKDYEISGADLMSIVRGCPKLKYLSLGGILDAKELSFVEDTFLPMIRGLSFLEFLDIGSKFRIDGAVLEEISRCCPRLAFLELALARVDISLTKLRDTCPLSYLRGLILTAVWFEHPKHLLQNEMLEELALEWRRVFPKLALTPCHGDIYWNENDAENDEEISDENMSDENMSDDDMSDDDMSDDDMSDEDISAEYMVYPKPLLDFDDYGSSWFKLRVKLWRILNYSTDTYLLDKMRNIWKRNFEVEMTGWPVVPFAAFLDPNLNSTTSREYD